MAISKGWKWEVLSKDDEYWNTPDFMIHYLDYRWKKLGFKDFLDRNKDDLSKCELEEE